MAFFRCIKGRHVGMLCVVGGVPLLAVPTVSAASEGNRVKISQLPLYDEDKVQAKYRYEADPPSSLEEAISPVRQAVCQYITSLQETTAVVTDKLVVAKAHTSDLITYVQEDPSILPKAGVITVAGLGGIVAGYRGGVLRKVILSSSAVTAATALCYPKEAVALTTEAYDTAYKYGLSLWEGDTSSPSSVTPNKTEPKPAVKDAAVKTGAVKQKLEDHGQSKPEDKDMYTTRGS